MGLVAAVMSRWPASRQYSFGYGRVEVLSGRCVFYMRIFCEQNAQRLLLFQVLLLFCRMGRARICKISNVDNNADDDVAEILNRLYLKKSQ